MPSWCWRTEASDNAHPAFSKMFVETEIAPNKRRHLRHAAQARARTSRTSRWRISSPIRPATGARCRGRDRPARLHRPRPHASPMPRPSIPAPSLAASTASRSIRSLSLRRQRARAGQQEGLADLLDRRRRQPRRTRRSRSPGSTIPKASPARRCSPGPASQVQTRHVGLSLADAANVQKLARYLIYPDPFLRLPAESIASGLGKQSSAVADQHFRRLPDLRWSASATSPTSRSSPRRCASRNICAPAA